ncbi:PPC domain-containing DNA-binding protein [Desulfohalovibrio reitneri]|uniref:PPC domain-containing DNA-binding protein n=1 Tax=Desulfohalovibrio reitneri TaxID=1307759 RepID=UPI0004A7565E|nr:DUF296 domain-containing protein [Desulfohalovibrio reitneri]
MIVSQGRPGRIFTIRLEDDELLPHALEDFAREHDVKRASVTVIGGADEGELVVGPVDGEARRVTPVVQRISEAHEVFAVGTIFPSDDGVPKLHLHGSFGRGDHARTGCCRKGVEVWRLAEVIIIEIEGSELVRRPDPEFGFEVLDK